MIIIYKHEVGPSFKITTLKKKCSSLKTIQEYQFKINHSYSYQLANFYYTIKQAVGSCAAISHMLANCPHGYFSSGSCEVASVR